MASRLLSIEGLRGYLALWVLVCHVMWYSGYETQVVTGLPKLISDGQHPVNLFIIISGFVIMLALDKHPETYLQFLLRRFFRLFPVFLALFVIAIPLSQVFLWNNLHSSQYLISALIQSRIDEIESWWANIQWHIPLHLLLLHGTVPEALISGAPEAFLTPAWSLSLEWQFYLVAPFVYAWALSTRTYQRLTLCAVCVVMVLAGRYMLPPVHYDAALPFHVKYFFIGAVSYFYYRRMGAQQFADNAFPVACCLAIFVYGMSERAWSVIPLLFWMVFLGALFESPTSISSRLVSPLLTNSFVRYLGRISYSLYLSHILVLAVIQYALLTWAPQLTQIVHFGLLLVGTTIVSVSVSAVLYHYIEIPGMDMGRALTSRLTGWREVTKEESALRPVRAGSEIRDKR